MIFEIAPGIDEVIVITVHRVTALPDAVDHQRVAQITEINDLPQGWDTVDFVGFVGTPAGFLDNRLAPVCGIRTAVENILDNADA
jgi:hypothetical protein